MEDPSNKKEIGANLRKTCHHLENELLQKFEYVKLIFVDSRGFNKAILSPSGALGKVILWGPK